jgi:uncharacterized protein (DUF433 family)
MSDHFTLRFQTPTTKRLERRARATGAKPRTLAARYVEEGLRHDDHPLIHFVDGPSGRRAAVIGTGLDVWEIVATVRDNGNDLGEAAEYLDVSRGLVEAAITYYGEFQVEIDEQIAVNAAESERALNAWRTGQQTLEP